MQFEKNYLATAVKQFEYYKMLGEKTFAQIPDEALFWTSNEHTNSISIIVNHLWGNMMSRWTDFLNADGEKSWRQRDEEFENIINNRSQLLEKWEEGWTCLFTALDSINDDNFDNTVYIRNIGHTIQEAITRQLCHYAYHIGQIVHIGKITQGDQWISLSIPKGASQAYNDKKFKKAKHKGHFTDEFLDTES